MNTPRNRVPETASQCELLGIKDDARTSLAFPSTWNYCHLAAPPHSVRLEHQRGFCQSTEHARCPVFQREKAGPLPPDLRGRHIPTKYKHGPRAKVPALLVVVAAVIVLLGLVVANGLFGRARSPLIGAVTPGGSIAVTGRIASSTPALPVPPPFMPPTAAASPAVPTLANFSLTSTYSDPSPSTATPISTAPGVCGHELDEPFGPENNLIIHRVGGGDSLNRYEILYNTSVEVLLGVNLPFPMPMRTNQLLVIPTGRKELGNLPVLEPLLVSNRNTAIQTMAFKVSADLLAFEEYNGFDASCQDFIGWVVAPRERPAQ